MSGIRLFLIVVMLMAAIGQTNAQTKPVQLIYPGEIVASTRSSYGVIPTGIDYTADPSFSVTFYLFVTTTYNQWRNIFQYGQNDGDRVPALYICPDQRRLYPRMKSGTSWDQGWGCTNTDFPLNKWFQVLWTISPTEMKIYQDGALVGSQVLSGEKYRWDGLKNDRTLRVFDSSIAILAGSVKIRNLIWQNTVVGVDTIPKIAEPSPQAVQTAELTYGSSKVVLPAPTGINYATNPAISVSMYLYITSTSGDWRSVFNYGADQGIDSNDRSPALWIVPNTQRFTLRMQSTSSFNTGFDQTSDNFPLNRWFHVLLTISSQSMNLYQDGVNVGYYTLTATEKYRWVGDGTGRVIVLNHNAKAPNTIKVKEVNWYNGIISPVVSASNAAAAQLLYPGEITMSTKQNYGINPFGIDYDTDPSFSVSFDMYVTQTFNQWRNIIQYGQNDGDRVPALYICPGQRRLYPRMKSGTSWDQGWGCNNADFPLNKWFQVLWTISPTEMKFFQDGVLVGSQVLNGEKFRWDGFKGDRTFRIFDVSIAYLANTVKVRNIVWQNTVIGVDAIPKIAAPLPQPVQIAELTYGSSKFVLPAPTGINYLADPVISISLYAFITSTSGEWRSVFNYGADQGIDSTDRSPALWIVPNTQRFTLRMQSTSSFNTGFDQTLDDFPLNRWFHILITISSQSMNLYQDGVNVGYYTVTTTEKYRWVGDGTGRVIVLNHNAKVPNTIIVKGVNWYNGIVSSNTFTPTVQLQPLQVPEISSTKFSMASYPYSVDFNLQPKFSISLQLFVSNTNQAWRNVFIFGVNDGDRTPGLFISPSGNRRLYPRMRTTTDVNRGFEFTNIDFPLNQWFRVLITITTTSMKVYQDGTLVGTLDLTGQEIFTWGGFVAGRGIRLFDSTYNVYDGSVKIRNMYWYNDILTSDTLPESIAVPLSPRIASAVSASSSSSQATLSWSSDDTIATSYKLYQNGLFVSSVQKSVLNYTFTGLTNNVTYLFAVSAVNFAGESQAASVTVIAGATNINYNIAIQSLIYTYNFATRPTNNSINNNDMNTTQYTLPNGGTWSTGSTPYNGIVSLDGVNQYIDLGILNNFGGLSSWTASIWVRVDTTNNQDQAFARLFELSNDKRGWNSVVLARDGVSNGITFRINNAGNISYVNAPNVIKPNTWMHLMVTQEIDLPCGWLDTTDLRSRVINLPTTLWDNTRPYQWNIENQRKYCESNNYCYNEYTGIDVRCWSKNSNNKLTTFSRRSSLLAPLMAKTTIYRDFGAVAIKSMPLPVATTRTRNYIGRSTYAGDKCLQATVDSFTLSPNSLISPSTAAQTFFRGVMSVGKSSIVSQYTRSVGPTVNNVTVIQSEFNNYVVVTSRIIQTTDAKLQRRLTSTTTQSTL